MNNHNITVRFACIITALVLTSCVNKQVSNETNTTIVTPPIKVEEYSSDAIIIECESDLSLPPGIHLGQVIECIGRTKDEDNMLSQFKTYSNALMRGDSENASHYMYPDVAKYFKRYFPELDEDNIMKRLIEDVSDDMIKGIREYENRGVELENVASRVVRKVMQEDKIIYVFECVSNLISEKIQIHTQPETVVGISVNNGVNWFFNTVNEDTPNILRMSFPSDFVDRVMGY